MVLSSLIQSESGGNWRAQNAVPGSGGVGHFGRLQFSRGRLQDAARAGVIPEGVTPEQFMSDPALQQRVEQWHFEDIDRFIDRNNLAQFEGQTINGVPVTRSGMHAVAHLGGSGGLQRFLESGGQYNPADAYGTSLLDYLGRHGGQDMATRQDTTRPGGILAALNGSPPQGQAPQQAQRGSMWDNAPLGLSDPDRRARLAMAFEGMTLSPNAQLMAALQGDIEGRREDARTAQARNATAEWLRANGRDDLAGVVEAGGLQGAQAMGLAMEAMQRQQAAGQGEAQRNATAEWLASQGRDDLAGAIRSGALTGAQAFEAFNAEPDLTTTQREYNQAVAEGFQGTLMDYRRQLAEAGRSQTNVSVGDNGRIGSVPQGYTVVDDPASPAGVRMVPIPGGPADVSGAAERREGRQQVTGDIVLNAANLATDLFQQGAGGLTGAVAGLVPSTQSADLYRQVGVLRSQARFTNLQAMREASPTGGALGAVSDSEGRTLEAAAGALDPASPTFPRDVADFTRNLLRTVHGPEAGDRIFNEQYNPGQSGAPSDFSQMGLDQLLVVDPSTLNVEQIRQWMQRMDEVQQ